MSFQWPDEFEESFQKLKTLFTSALTLTLPEMGVDFTVHWNVFGVTLDEFLMYKGKMIAYSSRQLDTHERSTIPII